MALQSNFRSNKLFFESLFFAEWQDTPIHFAGQEFAVDGIKEWVNPFFNPIGGRFTGVSGTLTENHASFSVVCWSDTDSNVMELADKVVTFVSQKATAYKLKGYEVTDHAWHDSNSVYIFLTFDVKMYKGSCGTSAPVVKRFVVNRNVDIVNKNVTIIN